MIEQASNAITFFAKFTSAKVGKTGLTVYVAVNKGATNVISRASNTTATALDATNMPGIYTYTLASGSVDGEENYIAEFRTTDTTVDQQEVPALWVVGKAGVENLDVSTSTRLATAGYTAPPTVAAVADAVWDETMADHLTTGTTGNKLNAASAAGDPWGTSLPGSYGSGSAGSILGALSGAADVTISSPVAANGDVTVRQGKDYAATIGTALQWTLSSPPGTTPTSVSFTCRALGFSKACTYSSPTITLTLTAAETAAFAAGAYKFEIEAVISTLNTALVAGTITVERDV